MDPFNQYLSKMKVVQDCLLDFLENDTDEFQKLNNLLDDFKIKSDKHELKTFIGLLSSVSENHHRNPGFLDKIGQIILILKDQITKIYSNIEIFQVFKGNKNILLFLKENNMLNIDYTIYSQKEFTLHFKKYFFPEIKSYINDISISKEIPDNFEEMRKKRIYDDILLQLLQNDVIDDFIKYVGQNSINLNMTIKPSYIETNQFLIDKNPSLIEYAAFFGSINIFKYFISNKIKLEPSIVLYAIHGKNHEIIHLILDNTKADSKETLMFYEESIKCHHNDIAMFFETNYIQHYQLQSIQILQAIVNSYNFEFIRDYIIYQCFFDICRNDYYFLVENILKLEKYTKFESKKIFISIYGILLLSFMNQH